MGAVDHSDQIRGYYHTAVKCRKCYKYIFWFLFDVAITNSFILCKEFSALNIQNLKTFRVELAKQLIGNYNSHVCSMKPDSKEEEAASYESSQQQPLV